jgi:hypothetical protein
MGADGRVEGDAPGARRSVPDLGAEQRIIWIASYQKSGNTWLRVFIHNLLAELAGNSTCSHDINRLDVHTVWEIPAGPFEQVLGKPVTAASHAEIARARPEVQRRLANSRASPFFVKTPISSVARSRARPFRS